MTTKKIIPIVGAQRLPNSTAMFIIDEGDIDDIVNKYMKCSENICHEVHNASDSNNIIDRLVASSRVAHDIFAIGVADAKKNIFSPRDITIIYRIRK